MILCSWLMFWICRAPSHLAAIHLCEISLQSSHGCWMRWKKKEKPNDSWRSLLKQLTTAAKLTPVLTSDLVEAEGASNDGLGCKHTLIPEMATATSEMSIGTGDRARTGGTIQCVACSVSGCFGQLVVVSLRRLSVHLSGYGRECLTRTHPTHAMRWLSSSARGTLEMLGRRQILHGLRQFARLGKLFAQH